MTAAYLLVMAKAPVSGYAKTRLCPPATHEQAARIAAASLLDTLDAALDVGVPVVVALAGDLDASESREEIAARLRSATVIGQRGEGLADRLANAHAEAARRHPGAAVIQIGSDTPQVTGSLLRRVLAALTTDGSDAVIGPATDGGWWLLGLRDPDNAHALGGVPMSTPDTGVLTAKAVAAQGLRVNRLPVLSDVDTMADAVQVAAEVPGSRFARAVAEVGVSSRPANPRFDHR